jgi:hypothetical protein
MLERGTVRKYFPEGMRVEFERIAASDGRNRAVNVRPVVAPSHGE